MSKIWRCPECETLNQDRKCVICGYEIPDQTENVFKKDCKSDIKPQYRKNECEHTSMKVYNDSEITVSTHVNSNKSVPSHKSKSFFKVIAVALSVMAVLGIAFLVKPFLPQNKDSEKNISTEKEQLLTTEKETSVSEVTTSSLTSISENDETTISLQNMYQKLKDKCNSKILIFEYDDYDGNSTYEAFAVTVTDNSEYYVYFINEYGEITYIGKPEYEVYNTNKSIQEYDHKKFFYFDYGAGGSGWKTMLFSVRNGVPYELEISRSVQGFYYENGVFYTTENDFSNGYHEYPKVELIYDKDKQQFVRGERIVQNDEMLSKKQLDLYAKDIANSINKYMEDQSPSDRSTFCLGAVTYNQLVENYNLTSDYFTTEYMIKNYCRKDIHVEIELSPSKVNDEIHVYVTYVKITVDNVDEQGEYTERKEYE